MNKEVWKEIEFTDGRYKVSNRGNIIGPSGNSLKPTLLQIGYLSVAISFGNRKVKRYYIHRLVAEVFVGPIPKDYVVNHINHNKIDNRLENLELVTRKSNAIHWAKQSRSSKAGRKRSGYCGRGHLLVGERSYCLECRRSKRESEFNPPSEYIWKKTSVDGYLVSNTGLVWSEKTKRILKFGINKPGYKYVNLRIADKTKNYSISRLVFEAFIGLVNNGNIIDHINSNKLDNRLENLRILSRKDNSIASRDKMRNDKKHGFKLSEEIVAEIKWLLLNSNFTQKEIAIKYGLTQSTVSDIKLGYKWAHIRR
jgi:hypothetical protein